MNHASAQALAGCAYHAAACLYATLCYCLLLERSNPEFPAIYPQPHSKMLLFLLPIGYFFFESAKHLWRALASTPGRRRRVAVWLAYGITFAVVHGWLLLGIIYEFLTV